MTSKYESLAVLLKKLSDINYASGLLQWDQEVNMPEKGGEIRAQQLSTLAGLSHETGTSSEMENLLSELIGDSKLDDRQKRNVKEAYRNFTDRKKYTTQFVIEMSTTVSQGFQAWQQAKKENNFNLFAPHLQKLMDLKLKECELLGYEDHPYDALLNQHEPGMTTKQLKKLFSDVRTQLVPYVQTLL